MAQSLSDKRVVIVGAGMAGSLASAYLASYKPTVYEARSGGSALDGHSAIMRLRDPAAGLLLGCDMEQVIVHKMAYMDGRLTDLPSITINNRYSMKVSGAIREKSILELGRHKRYLVSGEIKPKGDIFYGCNIFKAASGKLWYDIPVKGQKLNKKVPNDLIEYDICISTIPLPEMLKITGICSDVSGFKFSPIHVTRMLLDIDSDVHQTIYFPDIRFASYRVTLQKNVMIIEATEEVTDSEIDRLFAVFGLRDPEVTLRQNYTMKYGKLLAIDDDIRRMMILELSQRFSIYSFGRYGIWRQLRTDHLVQDIEKIAKMIRVSEIRRRYESHIT